MLDGNSAAEIEQDKGDISSYMMDKSRFELIDKAWDGLNFDTILDALAEMPEMNQEEFTRLISLRKKDPTSVRMVLQMIDIYVNKHITPSETETAEYANKLINEE